MFYFILGVILLYSGIISIQGVYYRRELRQLKKRHRKELNRHSDLTITTLKCAPARYKRGDERFMYNLYNRRYIVSCINRTHGFDIKFRKLLRTE
jgi:hypothetical protein